MKKIIISLTACVVMAAPFTVFADDGTPEKKDLTETHDVSISTHIDPTYQVSIPENTTVAFNAQTTDFGTVELLKAQLEPDAVVRASVTSNGALKNGIDETKVLPYTLSAKNDDFSADDINDLTYDLEKMGDKLDISINITEEDWNKAYSGDYSDTVTFNFSYVKITEPGD